jgi:hypothetical protein
MRHLSRKGNVEGSSANGYEAVSLPLPTESPQYSCTSRLAVPLWGRHTSRKAFQ